MNVDTKFRMAWVFEIHSTKLFRMVCAFEIHFHNSILILVDQGRTNTKVVFFCIPIEKACISVFFFPMIFTVV